MTSQSPPKLEIKGLVKAFGGKRVLTGIDLSIARGELLVLMGESGSGKSVLAKCVLGLLPIDDGCVYNDGMEISTRSESALENALRRFGVLFQKGALFDSLSTWQNVAFGLIEGRGMEPAHARAIALKTMAKVGLGVDVADLTPAELSGGMRKRVALARAIVADPELLILDEPVEGLDPIMTSIVTEMIAGTVRSMGATIFAITNNIACAEKLATRIVFLHGGKIIWQGLPGELNNSGNPYVACFTHSYFENFSA
jgi:phospholipid/cholesterol/gamma-HCH transport system ATP-binding protein